MAGVQQISNGGGGRMTRRVAKPCFGRFFYACLPDGGCALSGLRSDITCGYVIM
ncbi:hypothetical protein CKO_01306 [Citrobacter koseri ATCC BAA-895]|uniref:Uncharacterized protein n=1 Tax=Citrobacter koseri (strain ATCC BAA-895 / CDC 4225-83 / SGSC4696) TaxID=290338 RepID=A8AG33_CITK8|nr:hypothetical protein CKO_01306 [Citrobacter koseri ATCC BAA-895]